MLVSILNGFAIGFLLFILAVGLSLVFGMMDVLNLAHGALFLGGAYVGATLAGSWGGFLGALAIAAVGGLVGGVLLSLMTEPLRRRSHLDQALLTLGVALIAAELLIIVFGDDPLSAAAPPGLDGSVSVLGAVYPTYRLLIIVIGAVLALAVYIVVDRTRVGALVRATVADREMVATLGIDNRLVKGAVFAVGSVLATVAGVLGGPIYGARPGLDATVLILALVVVVIGGLGSVRGALVGALVIGQIDTVGRVLLPDFASFVLFGALALVLVLRPQGLFGTPAVAR
ncbi:branched-chain amino acid ABC transporter permease [Pseudonocardia sp. KRD-184]|uniref:Branched-chain amino acid ABC transporter permease n=1 Tax=Pseudonocardia oceani TaxID=2792013 RepID=A0ABS6UH39_9PSEU|nr:branched-chain amino acid ABC transporter permease [Pseudonocardia oceani]MBW0091901.1 branched-chain amino acid ABC transporter permease [Pseudonocardia oceani]MBW0098990.1 branched-chain amino acid ABC transporter permease [Pseudonocardia oceani]MBW0109872.1 branched-chain amino acid ABC transporter permease [Pseudonocardia oceani]MBW0120152.1 branched-chain amino acid ABC transporter permease [Pseudonocardia oceani]MBW0131572.1 branched-chain amino acid ABC transporter permease [Pseudono